MPARALPAANPTGHSLTLPVDSSSVVATHLRRLHKNTEHLVLDHYLEVLVRKPGALASATALVAARASGAFTLTHQRFWDAARRALGDAAGTRVLIGVLLLHRSLPAHAIDSAMAAALRLGRFDADLVAVEARRSIDATGPVADLTALQNVADIRPLPSLRDYDTSAPHRTADRAGGTVVPTTLATSHPGRLNRRREIGPATIGSVPNRKTFTSTERARDGPGDDQVCFVVGPASAGSTITRVVVSASVAPSCPVHVAATVCSPGRSVPAESNTV